MFYIVFELKQLFISLQPDVRLRWGLDQNVAILIGQVIYIEKSKLKIADMSRGTIAIGPVHSFSRSLNHALARNGVHKQHWMIIDACGQHQHDDVITVLIC